MGDVVDLAALRAGRQQSQDVRLDGAVLRWDRAVRIAHLIHEAGAVLDAPQARAIGRAVVAWVGDVPDRPYGFLIEAAPGQDALGTVAYRQQIGRGAARHREWGRLVLFGGTPRARFEAQTYVRGIGGIGTVVETEAQARRWLADQGLPS